MHLDRDPDRSSSLSPPSSDDEDNNDNNNQEEEEEELLEAIAQKEAEMIQTQQLINQRMRQVEQTLDQLRRANQLLEQFHILEQTNKYTKN